MNTTSASLLERLREPADRDAWGRFVRIYTPLIYSFTGRLGVPEQDRSDVVQQVFTLLLQKLPAFAYDQHRRFRGWLWTVTMNQWRAYRRQHRTALLDGNNGLLVEAPDHQEPPGEEEYRQYLVGRAIKLMQREFQPNTWKAFWECVTSDEPVAKIAARLDMTVASVYAAKSRVLRRLRTELAGLLD